MQFELHRFFFSLSTFLAAVCAYFFAELLHFELPFWSFATVYIVANPTIGMLRAKSLWRVIGTLAGALYTILVLARLPEASFILGVAIALWIGLCMYLMLLGQAPQNYAYMLAGYTSVLIVFPSLDLHERLADIALTRSGEVLVGCVTAWIFSEVLASRKAGATAASLFKTWHADACAMARQALGSDKLVSAKDLARLSRQATHLHLLLRHSRYESTDSADHIHGLFVLESEMRALAPMIHAISHRRAYLLQHHANKLDDFRPLLNQLLTALETDNIFALEKADVAILQADQAFSQTHPELIDVRPYIRRLHIFCQSWISVRLLSHKIEQGEFKATDNLLLPHYVDFNSALRGALGALLTTWLSYELWRQSGWPEAALTCMFGAMASSIFAAGQQGAVRKTLDYLLWSYLGAGLAAIYLYYILPQTTVQWLLPFSLAITYIPLGYLMKFPPWNMRVMYMTTIAAGQLAFLYGHLPSIGDFIAALFAQGLGISLAAMFTWLLTPSAKKSLELSYEQARKDLVAALSRDAKDLTHYPVRSLARIGWAAEVYDGNEDALLHLSAYHRMLANVFLLNKAASPASQALIDSAKQALLNHFHQPQGQIATADLIAQLRKICNALLLNENAGDHTAAIALAGIEVDLVMESWAINVESPTAS